MHDYFMLIISFLICFVKKELGERGENFLIEQREEFCQHMQSFAVFYGFFFHFCCKVFGFQKKALGKPLFDVQQRFQEISLRAENSTLGFLTHFCWNMVSR